MLDEVEYADVGIKDMDGKYPFEIDLPVYTKARVRILETLREQFYDGLSGKTESS